MTYPVFDQADTARRVGESFDSVAWAARLTPSAYTHELPSSVPPDSWTVAMNLAHLVVYDEGIAIPILESMAAGEDGTTRVRTTNENWFYNDAVALAREPLETLLARLETSRSRQSDLVAGFSAADFNRRWTPAFGSGLHGNAPHSPAWVANKTFQHTWEHGNAVLRMMLFAPRDGA